MVTKIANVARAYQPSGGAMPDLAKINRALTYLREEIPAEDISKNPVVKHPHNTTRLIPERLHPAKIRELSRLRPAKAIATTLGKWALIAVAIAIAQGSCIPPSMSLPSAFFASSRLPFLSLAQA